MTHKPIDRFVWERKFRMTHELKGPTVAVALTIAGHVNAATGITWPSIETLAREAGVGQTTVKKAIKELTGVWITKVSSGGGRSSNRYALRLPSGSPRDQQDSVVGRHATTYKETPRVESPPPLGAIDYKSDTPPSVADFTAIGVMERDAKLAVSNWNAMPAVVRPTMIAGYLDTAQAMADDV